MEKVPLAAPAVTESQALLGRRAWWSERRPGLAESPSRSSRSSYPLLNHGPDPAGAISMGT